MQIRRELKQANELHVCCQFRLDQLTVTVENTNKPQEPQKYVVTDFIFIFNLYPLICN